MDNDKKRDSRGNTSSELLPSIDSANRARNRTVMLTPEMTGQMRARMTGGDYEPTGPMVNQGRIGHNSPDSGWEDTPRNGNNGRMQSLEAPPVEDDEPDWTRPIEPAIMSDSGDSSSGDETGSDAPSWAPPTTGFRAESSVPRVVRNGQAPFSGSTNDNVGEEYSPPFQAQYNDYQSQEPERHSDSRPSSEPVRQSNVQPILAAGNRPEEVFWKTLSPLVGFLVTFDNDPMGAYTELRSGRLIVTSEREATGNCLVISDSSVSPMHAIMRVTGGLTIQILDQLSENGTRIRRFGSDDEELLSGEKSTLSNGDVVIFGERKYHVCLLSLSA